MARSWRMKPMCSRTMAKALPTPLAGVEGVGIGQGLHQLLHFVVESGEVRVVSARGTADLGGEGWPVALAGQVTAGVEHVLAVFQRLRGGVKLKTQHMARLVGAHGDVVFGVGTGGNGVHAGRVRARGQVC